MNKKPKPQVPSPTTTPMSSTSWPTRDQFHPPSSLPLPQPPPQQQPHTDDALQRILHSWNNLSPEDQAQWKDRDQKRSDLARKVRLYEFGLRGGGGNKPGSKM